jgi:hypothetical protein
MKNITELENKIHNNIQIAIAQEQEFEGPMPFLLRIKYIWFFISNRRKAENILRACVRMTKENIYNRFIQLEEKRKGSQD